MIYELLSTALLACSLGAGNYRDEPKRVVFPPSTFGQYEASVSYYVNGAVVARVIQPDDQGVNKQFDSWEAPNNKITLTTPNGLMTSTFTISSENGFAIMKCDCFTTFNFSDKAEKERFNESYFQMQEDHSYTTATGVDIDELTNEAQPEVYWSCEWQGGIAYDGYLRMTLPLMYQIDLETFGTTETSRVSYMKAGTEYAKTFNAIYEDNTEPKLYAFWLDKYMLARQVRLNGDIINQNYVTGMDRVDPSFGKQVYVRFTPSDDVYLKVSAVPYEPTWELTNDYNTGYNAGFQAGKTEGEQPVSWIKTTFDGLAGFFNIQVFPFVTLGFLCFAPLIVVAIIAIVRIIKHE